MKLQNGGEYIESLRALNPVIYYKENASMTLRGTRPRRPMCGRMP